MTIYNLAAGGTIGTSEQSARKHILFANTVDFSVNNILSTDVASILNIPANFWMTMFGVRLDVAEGGTATAVFGDGTNPDGWLASAFDLNGAVDTFAQSGLILLEAAPPTPADLFHPGKYYPAADTIDIDPANDLATAVITCWATGFILDDTYIVPSSV